MHWILICSLAGTSHAMAGPELRFNHDTGNLASIHSPDGHEWLEIPWTITVRNEVTGATASPRAVRPLEQTKVGDDRPAARIDYDLSGLDLQMTCSASVSDTAGELTFDFTGDAERVGHEVIIDLPVLMPRLDVFTPSERGVMSVDMYRDYDHVHYGHFGWDDGRYYVLPLVSLLDRHAGKGVTFALPADDNIPHLHVSWHDARTLRLRLGHRGMGGDKPSKLTLQMLFHDDDYRSVIKAYSDRYPRYFKPAAEEIPYQGSFWYHHIHAHPDIEELERQHVNFIWMSFWFTHLGEYLPNATEWKPYTYARWWSLGETMSDERIRAFIRKMHDHDIGAYAYFNVTEYGGVGGESGGGERANQILQEQFADALMRDANLAHIPTWEGAVAMNARKQYSLFPFLKEQLELHLERLPEIDGFAVDRLDWASKFDYAHHDGLSMIGDKPVENMAGPVAEGLAEVCRQAHAADKVVFVNQFWRVEVLKDVDGYCCEYDNPRGLGYLAPYRPVSAWNHSVPYRGELLPFEAQLKRRLHFAVFPQMIAREFPISQQLPDPEAADMLELYAPLFSLLIDKQQVLDSHCVEVTGPNAANLFVNPEGNYIVPVTSRVNFITRAGALAENAKSDTTVTLNVVDPDGYGWVHVYRPEGPVYRGDLKRTDGRIVVIVPDHQSVSMIVVGKGQEPALPDLGEQRRDALRQRLFPSQANPSTAVTESTKQEGRQYLAFYGRHLGPIGEVNVLVDGDSIGRLDSSGKLLPLPEYVSLLPTRMLKGDSPKQSRLHLVTGDEGTWYLPSRVELVARGNGDRYWTIGEWEHKDGWLPSSSRHNLQLRIRSCPMRPFQPAQATLLERSYGTRAASGSWATWLPMVYETSPQHGFELQVERGNTFKWADHTTDERVPEPPAFMGTAGKPATCWFDAEQVKLQIVPPGGSLYRLGLYLLDYDRQNRTTETRLVQQDKTIDSQTITAEEAAKGTLLTWRVSGPVQIEVINKGGANTVVSGVFIDPP
jgi:hypothetical protein